MVRLSVASATDGAAPNKPAKLFGRSTSPSAANADTAQPPIRKRQSSCVIVHAPSKLAPEASKANRIGRRKPHDQLDERELFLPRRLGTRPPARRASDRPMAIACLRLVTFLPERPLRKVPRLRLC